MQVSVRDLMTSQPPTVDELTTVEDATRLVLERALNEIYVVDDEGRLLGTVSDYELLKARILKSDSTQLVTRCMSRSMLLLAPEMMLDEVAGFFRESCYARLAVVEDGKVVGQLTRRDVLRTLLVLEELAAEEMADTCEPVDGSSHIRIEAAEAVIPPMPATMSTERVSSNIGSAVIGE